MNADGEVNGRIDADTFRIWKGTEHPEEAFEVLSYLITTVATHCCPPTVPCQPSPARPMPSLKPKSADYPFVTPESWDVFVQGLAYPDSPSPPSSTCPTGTKAFARIQTFGDLMNNTADLDIDAEFDKLQADLTVIFNK